MSPTDQEVIDWMKLMGMTPDREFISTILWMQHRKNPMLDYVSVQQFVNTELLLRILDKLCTYCDNYNSNFPRKPA